MSFQRPPQGVEARSRHDGITVALHPYLTDHGRGDLKWLLAVVVGAAVTWRAGLLVAKVVDPRAIVVVGALAAAELVAGAMWLGLKAVRRSRLHRARLELAIGRNELRLVESVGGLVDREERVFLRDVGRVDVEEAGYQRPHVVASVAGRDPLDIPMERHTAEAARWLAAGLARAGREARERDGAGVGEIPRELRRLTE